MSVLQMSEVDLNNKRVLIREDLNVPIKKQAITNSARLEAALPTLRAAINAQAKVMVMSHLGRPTEGEFNAEFSLAPIADYLSDALNQNVRFIKNWLTESFEVKAGEIVLLENVRFNKGEEKNDPTLAKKMAQLCDVFVMDAFGTAHRAQTSTYGVAEFAPIACAGPLLMAELNALAKALEKPAHPLVAIVGGSKVSSKLKVLEVLINKVDQLIVGGGIANTFLAANGINIGKSLYEPDLIDTAKKLIQLAKEKNASIPLPLDVVVAKEFSADAKAQTKLINEIAADDMILDIGPQTAKQFATYLTNAGTILWNGPVGVFEFDQFAQGTVTLAQAIATSKAFSIAGGGDTLAAIDKCKIENEVSYISTGGGAFLEFIENGTLPAIQILQQREREKV